MEDVLPDPPLVDPDVPCAKTGAAIDRIARTIQPSLEALLKNIPPVCHPPDRIRANTYLRLCTRRKRTSSVDAIWFPEESNAFTSANKVFAGTIRARIA